MNLKYLFAGIAFIVATLGAWTFLKTDNISIADVAENKPRLFNWQASTSQHYQLKIDSSMQMNSSGSGLDNSARVQWRSLLNLMTLSFDRDKALVGIQLEDVQLSISGQSDSELNEILETPFRVRFSSGGVPEKFEFPEGLTAQEQVMLKNVLLTFTVSNSEAGDSWVSQEENASGIYEAVYKRVSATRLEKQKRHFQASAEMNILKDAKISSNEIVELNPRKNWLTYMAVNETIEAAGNGGPAIRITNIAEIELDTRVQKRITADSWDFVAAEPIPDNHFAKAKKVSLSAEQARRQLIHTIPELDAISEGRTKKIHQLRDLLRVDGTIPVLLLEQMKTQEMSDRTRADLYLALELAATPEAQSALTSIIDSDEWSSRDAMRATVALAGINNPSPETLAVLWETAQSDRAQLSATATYTLGSMGSRMKDIGNPDYPSLRDDLLAEAYASSDSQQKATYIYALGNTRDSEIATDVTTFLEDDQAVVRRAAALALGLMPVASNSEILVSTFKNENNSSVRGAIAESLVLLPLTDSSTAMKTIGQALQNEQDEKARHSMASFMGKNIDQHPEYKPMLKKFIRTEPSKRVRQVIAEALASSQF